MSKISVLKAFDAYPPHYQKLAGDGYFDTSLEKREAYEKGYDQAMQDFLKKACKFLDDRIGIDQKIEVNENGEPLADSYITYCLVRKQEAERVINIFKNYMQDESEN